jgi:hypothetical protein
MNGEYFHGQNAWLFSGGVVQFVGALLARNSGFDQQKYPVVRKLAADRPPDERNGAGTVFLSCLS